MKQMTAAKKEGISYFVIAGIALIIWLCSCGNVAYGQVKKPLVDSVPAKRQFVFVEDIPSFRYVDSILLVVVSIIGYELPAKDADRLRVGMNNIINYRRRNAYYQDSVYNANLKLKK